MENPCYRTVTYSKEYGVIFLDSNCFALQPVFTGRSSLLDVVVCQLVFIALSNRTVWLGDMLKYRWKSRVSTKLVTILIIGFSCATRLLSRPPLHGALQALRQIFTFHCRTLYDYRRKSHTYLGTIFRIFRKRSELQ